MTEFHLIAEERTGESPFGLTTAPFAETSDDAFFFPSDQHLRALEFMGHSIWTRARLCVVTADQGCGKSLLIRRFLRDLDERVIAAAVQREQITAREFLGEILQQYGVSLEEHDKTDRRRLLERFLVHQAGMGRLCLLIVENAQSMHPLVLEELRCLAALEADGAKVLKLLMLGQPALNRVLESPRMSELVVRTPPRFSLGPLSEDQTAAYVAHRLRAAGSSNPDTLMPHTLMRRIHECSDGVPSRINVLCEEALRLTAEEQLPAVAIEMIDRAAAELGWKSRAAAAIDDARWAVNSRLTISMQGHEDREVELSGGRIIIGRGEEADVRIDSVFVSRYHALIVRDGFQDLLLDLGSTNGLLVNSRRIVRRALRHRDLIQLGPARVIYMNESAAGEGVDIGETVCFARPGFPTVAGDESAIPLAFGRQDTSGGR
jgi:type II secretory pathway predicted ATPase ExeA